MTTVSEYTVKIIIVSIYLAYLHILSFHCVKLINITVLSPGDFRMSCVDAGATISGCLGVDSSEKSDVVPGLSTAGV